MHWDNIIDCQIIINNDNWTEIRGVPSTGIESDGQVNYANVRPLKLISRKTSRSSAVDVRNRKQSKGKTRYEEKCL